MSAKPEPRPEKNYPPEQRNEETRTLTNLQKARFMLIKKNLEKYGLKPASVDIIKIMHEGLSIQHFFRLYKTANNPQLSLF